MIRSRRWESSALGPRAEWPDTLVVALNTMLACAFPALVFWGPQMIQFYNDAFIPLIGDKHPHALGQTARECWAEAWDLIGARLTTVLATGVTISRERELVPIRRRERVQDVYWNYSYSPIFDAEGAVAGILVICQDVTSEVVVSRNLKESQERLRLALTVAQGVGIFDWDMEHDRVFADAAFARIYRIDPARAQSGVSAREYINAIHPDDYAHVRHDIGRVMAGGPEYFSEYRIIQADGSARWVLVVGSATFGSDRKPQRLTGLALDVTQRKQIEQALQDSSARLRSIYSTSLQYMGLLSPDGTLLECNRASLQFAGNKREELIGKKFWDCPWFTSTPEMPDVVRQAVMIGAKGLSVSRQMLLYRPNGEAVPFDFSLTPVFDDEGKVIFLVPEGRNVSELKRAELALLESEKIAAVGRLASSIAHEINNPLEAVTNLIYLARLKSENSEVSDFLDAADQELRRVSNIANQTLRFHKQASNPRAISAEELFATVLTIYEGRFKNLNIAVEVEHRKAPPVVAFEGDIRQILNNLVGNAIDALGRGGRMLIRSHAGTDWKTGRQGMVLTVADNGPGMSRDVSQRIWEPFFTTKGIAGTGLGLWISKEIADRHECVLRVRSCQNPTHSGTVFRLFLPTVR